MNFLNSYLSPRDAQVVVEGVSSDVFEICNTVIQGTVLGPPLWNVLFNDMTQPAASLGGTPFVFADDLNVFRRFDRQTSNSDIERNMHLCRVRVHRWGKIKQSCFRSAEKAHCDLHPRDCSGDPSRLLGLLVDVKLLMRQAIEKILS